MRVKRDAGGGVPYDGMRKAYGVSVGAGQDPPAIATVDNLPRVRANLRPTGRGRIAAALRTSQ